MAESVDLTIKPGAPEAGKKLPRIEISTYILSQLISLLPKERTESSPLPENLSPIPVGQKFQDFLLEHRWGQMNQDDQLELVTAAKQTVDAILAPKTSVQLVLGSSKEMATTQLFSAGDYADDSLVLYQYKPDVDVHMIQPGQSPSDVSDALLAQLLNGPHLEGLQFELNLEDQQLLTFLTILDLVYTRQLKARLDGHAFPVYNFTSKAVWARFSEIRLGEDLMWLSALVPYLFPYFPNSLDKNGLNEELKSLGEEGLITPINEDVYQPSDFCLALSEGLLPMVSFGSCAISTGSDLGLHLGFMVGLNVNLVVKGEPSVEGNRVTLMGVDGVQLSRLLFELGLPKI